MSNPNESSESSSAVPAGTDVEKRMLSRDLAEAAQKKNRFWYSIGWTMMRRGLDGPTAKELVERDGNFVHWTARYLRSMRRTVETIINSSVSDDKAAQCPFRFACDVMRHFRTRTINQEEAALLIERRSRHIGIPKDLPFNDVESKISIRDLVNRFDQKPQDDQKPQA